MTERIDHAKVAAEMTGVAAITQDAEAVTHALLALVEQQNLANLIAIFNANAEAEIGYTTEGFDFTVIADRIREGMGL